MKNRNTNEIINNYISYRFIIKTYFAYNEGITNDKYFVSNFYNKYQYKKEMYLLIKNGIFEEVRFSSLSDDEKQVIENNYKKLHGLTKVLRNTSANILLEYTDIDRYGEQYVNSNFEYSENKLIK